MSITKKIATLNKEEKERLFENIKTCLILGGLKGQCTCLSIEKVAEQFSIKSRKILKWYARKNKKFCKKFQIKY